MNHTRFPKEDHLPDWARRDNQIKKGDPVECATHHSKICMSEGILISLTSASQICAYVSELLQFSWISELMLSCKNYMCQEKPKNVFIAVWKISLENYNFIYNK